MATIQEVYIALFGRPADPEGYNFYVAQTGNGADLSGVGALTSSPEYLDRFAGQNDTQKINQIFQDLFGRTPDATGLAFYLNLLTTGEATLQDIAIRIADGATGVDDAILANKVVAANRFTFSLDTEAEISAYAGDDAADAGRAFLAGVNENAASIPTLAETEAAIGEIVGVSGVPGAIANLAAAQEAQDAAVESAAALVAENDGVVRTDAELATFIENYTSAQAEAALTAANGAVATQQAELAAAQSTLATARVGASDAAVATNVANALSAARADTAAGGANELLNARNAAQAALQADVGVDGSDIEVLTDLRDAILAYASSTGADLNTDVDPGAATVTLAQLLASINADLNADPVVPANIAAELVTIADSDGAGADVAYAFGTAGSTGVEAALRDALATAAQRGGFIDAVADAQTALGADGGEGAALVAAEGAFTTRQNQIEAVANEQADVNEAQTYASELTALVETVREAGEDVVNAEAAFDDLGYNVPVTIDGSVIATTDADIFFFDEGTNGSVTNFGDSDILFLGEEYTAVEIAGNVNLSAGAGVANNTAGSASALEFFVQQQGSNTVLYIEQAAFEGNDTSGAFGGTTITLVGVDADSLSFDNGFLTIA